MQLIAKDGQQIWLYCWDEVEKPKGILQIFHGMSEHAGRYARFARFLNSRGYLVFGDDHRGHGKTAELSGNQGYLGEDGFNRVVEDEIMITDYIHNRYPDLPIYVLAHSFGSFVGQEYLTRYSHRIAGMILSGSAAQTGVKFHFASKIADIYCGVFKETKVAGLLDRLSFGSYNKRIPKAGAFAWLSRDEEEVNRYNDDTACGFVATANFYRHFCKALTGLYTADKLTQIRRDIPICLIAGKEDPVGEYGRRVTMLYELYRKQGLNNLNIHLYEGARHELLNEINREEVMEDIFSWLEQQEGYTY